jgi:hypothetical protein
MIKIAVRTMTIVTMRASTEGAASETKKKRWSETMNCEVIAEPPAGRGDIQIIDFDETH